jgi:hypothetical protein
VDPLAADNLVDARPLVRCGQHCYPPLKAAIEQLCLEWKANPANRRKSVVYARLAKSVDVAMAEYRVKLVQDSSKPKRGKSQLFSRYLYRFGRRRTEAKIHHLYQLLVKPVQSPSGAKISFQELLDIEDKPPAISHPSEPSETASVRRELRDTLNALTSLTSVVSFFRPKARLVNNVNIRKKHWDQICRFCEQPTEMQALLEGKITLRLNNESRENPSPSLCRVHRSREEDGRASSDYKRLKRNEPLVQKELQALSWASADKGPERPGLEAALLYGFHRHIVEARNLGFCDEAELAAVARSLLMQGMSDRKKLVVMMLCDREAVSSIANQLGIRRQSVYKLIQNIPARYQFGDRPQTGPSLVRVD